MTPTLTLFRKLILLSLACMSVSLLIDFAWPALIPSPIKTASDAYIDSIANDASIVMTLFELLLFIALLAASIATWIGLYTFKPWARTSNILLIFSSFLILPMMEYTLYSGWSAAVGEVSSLLWGAVTLLSYLSPVNERFARTE